MSGKIVRKSKAIVKYNNEFSQINLKTRQKRRFMLLPQEHTVMVRQTSKWGQIFLMSLVGLGATALATAWLYRIDEVITVQGRLVPQQGGVEVKSPVSGQLDQILVRNGEIVEEGQILMKFDVESAKEKRKTLERQLKLEARRLQDQLKSNKQRIETIERNISLTGRIITKMKPLEEGGAISELQLLQQENSWESQKDELIQLETKTRELNNDSETRSEDIRGQLTQLDTQLRNEAVKAPINGVVFNFKPDNNNYVAVNAESLLKIIPEGKLGAEVNVSNEDIGFIKAGQKVKVRVNAFPYTEYGEIGGEIRNIGADALPPDKLNKGYHFPVDIELKKSILETKEGVEISLQAGMTVTTNLKLRDRRLIELLGDLFANRGDSLKRLRQP